MARDWSSSSPSARALARRCSSTGKLLPHLEIAHQPFRKGETYNEQLGEADPQGDRRPTAGTGGCARRSRSCGQLFFFDHLYIGGGNARRVNRDDLD